MRIADVLKHSDDGQGGGAAVCYLPRPRRPHRSLLPCNFPIGMAVRKLLKGRKTNRCLDCGSRSKSDASASASAWKVKLEAETEAVVDSSPAGQHAKDVSFTIGLGVGLAVLTAASKNEFNKMMKLRLEMETLLKEVKDDIQRKDAISRRSDSSDILASSTSYTEVRSTNEQSTIVNCSPFSPFEKTTDIADCESCLKCGKPGNEDFILGVDRLEAEVQAELERLQFRLDAEEFSEHLQQQCSEIVKNASHEESLTESFGEPGDPDGWEQQNGVCPNELKKRLHELLQERQQEKTSGQDFSSDHSSFGEIYNTEEPKHGEQNKGDSSNRSERLHELLGARQEERIKELESSLEHFKHKLCQKELEVSWWKDIAKLISQHVTDAVHL